MKKTICFVIAAAGLLYSASTFAQDTKDGDKPKHKKSITISNHGISVSSEDSATTTSKDTTAKKDKERVGRVKLEYCMLDLGLNTLSDNTVYTDPSVVSYLNVPLSQRNSNLFDLKNGKSINVNIYPVMVSMPVIKTRNQRLYVTTGVGLQIYNFRYDNSLTYTKNPNSIIMDTIGFKKNKLAVDYLNVPLMLTAKTRLHKKTWLVYGAGITAGYRLTSWNKQVSDSRGKVKTHGNFDMADFNTCITGEFGIDGVVRFFGSYQLASMYNNGIEQHPIAFGFRIGGI